MTGSEWKVVALDADVGAVELQHAACGNVHTIPEGHTLRALDDHECPA